MLKLIEGDADTFAQRAEMYYRKRPELVNMIEDFYRSYRSLAERYELLKLESGNSFSNRGYLNKDWSFMGKSSASSSVICDSESEVDDPSEEEQVESKLREVPRNKNGNDLVNMKHVGGGEISQVGIKRERSDLSTYSFDSELSEVSYLGPEETKVETKLEEFRQKKSYICVVKQMIEKVESTEDKARAAADIRCFEHSDFHGKPKEGQDENNLAEFPEKGDGGLSNSNILTEEAGRIQSMIKKMAERSGGSSFEDLRVLHPEREETQGEHKLKEAPVKMRDNPETKLMSVVERLKGENMTFKAELEQKDEEKREVIRQLSLSIDILKGENDSMKKFIRDSKNRTSLFEFGKLKGVFSRKLFASQSKFPTTLVAL